MRLLKNGKVIADENLSRLALRSHYSKLCDQKHMIGRFLIILTSDLEVWPAITDLASSLKIPVFANTRELLWWCRPRRSRDLLGIKRLRRGRRRSGGFHMAPEGEWHGALDKNMKAEEVWLACRKFEDGKHTFSLVHPENERWLYTYIWSLHTTALIIQTSPLDRTHTHKQKRMIGCPRRLEEEKYFFAGWEGCCLQKKFHAVRTCQKTAGNLPFSASQISYTLMFIFETRFQNLSYMYTWMINVQIKIVKIFNYQKFRKNVKEMK